MKQLGVFWWNDKINFGDILSRDLLNAYGFSVSHTRLAQLNSQSVCSIGSILNWVPSNFSGVILGSGIMRPVEKTFPQARIWGVRGEMTRQVIGADKDIVLGDPGLLAAKLINRNEDKQYVLGLIPHFEHKNATLIQSLINKYPHDILLIDVEREPSEVLTDISKCSCISSSSLHGIIVADSLGIPAGWFRLDTIAGGGQFKYKDYGTAIDDELVPLKLSEETTLSELVVHCRSTPKKVDEVKFELDALFKRIPFEL
ncbi:polysaccharide pyruvyl transferase family protein [Alteromonas sp. D210916BOD_24]|uniref:polysaccharide pyruvyl transferase family protein n=1 Tax=Alteromonas sp. D210916BOD_24 TaxID=3157618 RepID=UPI00399D1846